MTTTPHEHGNRPQRWTHPPVTNTRLSIRQLRLKGVVQNPRRLATSVVKPETQVVTHLCYSDFEDILSAIDGLKGARPQ